MKTYTTLDVALVDLKTFQLYPGAEAFQSEFKDFAVSRLIYKFFDQQSLSDAENKLESVNISYKKRYGIQFDADSEMEHYPCVWIAFGGDSDLLKEKADGSEVNAKKMGKSEIKHDIGLDEWIFTKKAEAFFQKEVPGIIMDPVKDTTGKKEFFRLAHFHFLKFPFVYKQVKEITHATGKHTEAYVAIEADGRVNFSKEALQEIKDNVFCFCKSFEYDGKVYEAANPYIVATGAFAVKLKQQFGIDVNITPITLDHV